MRERQAGCPRRGGDRYIATTACRCIVLRSNILLIVWYRRLSLSAGGLSCYCGSSGGGGGGGSGDGGGDSYSNTRGVISCCV